MSAFTKRYLISILLLSVAAVTVIGAYSDKSYSGELYTKKIPMAIGNWYGVDIPMSERTYEILETRDTFMREYTNQDSEKVLFTIVFAIDNRKVAHPPEVCFAGSGWSRTDRDVQEIIIDNQAMKVNRLVLEKDSVKQVVLYLYKASDMLTANYYTQQINVIFNKLFRRGSSSALIRISSYADGDNITSAMERTRSFAGGAIPILEEHLP